MSKLLIAISSCQLYEDNGFNAPLRETWLPDAVKLGIDYKFFHGRGAAVKDDVIVVDCDDGYWDLTSKLIAKAKYTVENGYDYMFACLADCYACPERLLSCGFEQFDYFGDVYQHPGGSPYCQGGPGCFYSKKACLYLTESTTNYPNEDCWAGDVLNGHSDIVKGSSKNFAYCGPTPLKHNVIITNHLSTQPGGYIGSNMLNEHKMWLDSLK